jgi:hypothetical protein
LKGIKNWPIMTKITIILLVSSAIICTSAQDKKTGQHIQHFGTGVSLKSVKERLQVQPLPVPGFDVNMVSLIIDLCIYDISNLNLIKRDKRKITCE